MKLFHLVGLLVAASTAALAAPTPQIVPVAPSLGPNNYIGPQSAPNFLSSGISQFGTSGTATFFGTAQTNPTMNGIEIIPSAIGANLTTIQVYGPDANSNMLLRAAGTGRITLGNTGDGASAFVNDCAGAVGGVCTNPLFLAGSTSAGWATLSAQGQMMVQAGTGKGIVLYPMAPGDVNVYTSGLTGTYAVPPNSTYNCQGLAGEFTVCNGTDNMDGGLTGTPIPRSLEVYRRFGGAGTKGHRNTADFTLLLNGNTDDGPGQGSLFHTAVSVDMETRASFGGTAGFANASGGIFGIGGNAVAKSGSTFLHSVIYEEGDIGYTTGSSGLILGGYSVVLRSDNAVAPSVDATGFTVAARGGALPTIRRAFVIGGYEGLNAMTADGAIIDIVTNQFSGAGPTLAYGFDGRLGNFTGAFVSDHGGDMFNDGSYRVGRTLVNDGVIDPTGSVGVSATVTPGVAGSGFTQQGLQLKDPYGGIWIVNGVSGGAITSLTLSGGGRAPWIASNPPATPVTLTVPGGLATVGPVTATIAWSTGTTETFKGLINIAALPPTSCSGQPTGTVAAVTVSAQAGVLIRCP